MVGKCWLSPQWKRHMKSIDRSLNYMPWLSCFSQAYYTYIWTKASWMEEYKKVLKEFSSGLAVKYLVLPLLWLRFDPWPRNFCVPWVQPEKVFVFCFCLPRSGAALWNFRGDDEKVLELDSGDGCTTLTILKKTTQLNPLKWWIALYFIMSQLLKDIKIFKKILKLKTEQ